MEKERMANLSTDKNSNSRLYIFQCKELPAKNSLFLIAIFGILFLIGNIGSAISQELKVTGEHPFYSYTAEDWVKVKDLNIGDRLLNSKGEVAVITKINKIDPEDSIKVYNLQVGDVQDYYAGDVLVHNKDTTINPVQGLLRDFPELFSEQKSLLFDNIDSAENFENNLERVSDLNNILSPEVRTLLDSNQIFLTLEDIDKLSKAKRLYYALVFAKKTGLPEPSVEKLNNLWKMHETEPSGSVAERLRAKLKVNDQAGDGKLNEDELNAYFREGIAGKKEPAICNTKPPNCVADDSLSLDLDSVADSFSETNKGLLDKISRYNYGYGEPVSEAEYNLAVSEFLAQNQGLSTHLTEKYLLSHPNKYNSFDEILSSATMGMVKALGTYDHRLGYSFSTNYKNYFLAEVSRDILSAQGISAYEANILYELGALERKLGKVLNSEDITAYLLSKNPNTKQKTIKRYICLYEQGLSKISYEGVVSDPESGKNFGFKDPKAESPDSISGQRELERMLRKVIGESGLFSENEQKILSKRIFEGLDTLQIVEQLGISRQRVHQLEYGQDYNGGDSGTPGALTKIQILLYFQDKIETLVSMYEQDLASGLIEGSPFEYQEKYVLGKYFGFSGGNKKSLSEIGDAVGGIDKARTVLNRALRKLTKSFPKEFNVEDIDPEKVTWGNLECKNQCRPSQVSQKQDTTSDPLNDKINFAKSDMLQKMKQKYPDLEIEVEINPKGTASECGISYKGRIIGKDPNFKVKFYRYKGTSSEQVYLVSESEIDTIPGLLPYERGRIINRFKANQKIIKFILNIREGKTPIVLFY